MNAKSSKRWVLTGAFVAALTACGGGGDDAAGAPVEFSLTPSAVTWTFTGADCTLASDPVTVLINGGAGNYHVNSTHAGITATPATLVNGVYQFQIQKLAGFDCFEGMPVQVNDERHNIAITVASAASA